MCDVFAHVPFVSKTAHGNVSTILLVPPLSCLKSKQISLDRARQGSDGALAKTARSVLSPLIKNSSYTEARCHILFEVASDAG